MTGVTCSKTYLEELYCDLGSKAAIDVDATVSLIEALEEILAGKEPDDVIISRGLTESGLVLPGKSPVELAREVKTLRGKVNDSREVNKIIELRDSLYRFQSL